MATRYKILLSRDKASGADISAGSDDAKFATAKAIADSSLAIYKNAAKASVATSQTTASTSYTDLTTGGPAVTATIGGSGKAMVCIYSYIANATLGGSGFVGFAVSGDTTIAADDASAMNYQSWVNNGFHAFSSTFLVTGLTAGSNTFTTKYRVDTSTGTFKNRTITVIPL